MKLPAHLPGEFDARRTRNSVSGNATGTRSAFGYETTQDYMLNRRHLVALPVSALLQACRGDRVLPPPLAQVEKQFGTANSAEADASESLDLDVYLDASESMRGYTTPVQSNYRRVVGALLEANSRQYRVTRFRFPGASPLDSQRVNEILAAEFYNASDTPLSQVIERIADPSRRTRLAVLVSDLVLSDRNRDLSDLQNALNKLMSARVHLAILGFRSAFEGRYFVEAMPRPPLALSISQSIQDQARPFFLMVVAPNQSSMRRFENTVVAQLGPHERLSPTVPVLQVRTLRYAPDKDKNYWGEVNRPELLVDRNGFYTIYRARVNNGGAVPLQITAKVEEMLPLRSQENCKFDVRRCVWNGKSWLGNPSPAAGPILSAASDSAAIRFAWMVQPANAGQWAVYHALGRAGAGNVLPPKWVSEWSTDNDASVQHGNRTFRLRSLAETLLSSVADNAVFFEQFLAIGRS